MNKVLISSIGRTGTKSLSSYLDSIPGVLSFHEKERQDINYLFLSQLAQYSILSDTYLHDRLSIDNIKGCEIYVEVNPYLRFIKKNILEKEKWKLIYIIRNPKTYLESVYSRNLFQKDDLLLQQLPDNSDSISKNWHTITRFQKLCWYYYKVHSFILYSGIKFYKYEDLVNNQEVLKELLIDIGVNLNNVKNYNLPKLNTSRANRLKSQIKKLLKGEKSEIVKLDWNHLTMKDKDFYTKYCGTIGKKLGYELS